jgi:succinyl-CoA synthetase beta subunit
MKIHEHQAKALLAAHGVPVPDGQPAFSVEEAVDRARELGPPVVVKAQIHAGGRGKGGGVRLARTLDEVAATAKALLGQSLVTHQTGAEGRIVRRLLIEKAVDLEGGREMYCALLVDRGERGPVLLASAQGGVDIEELAQSRPEAILRERIAPGFGLQSFQALRLAVGLGLPAGAFPKVNPFLQSVCKAFGALDASLVEINPWLLTRSGELLALDAKVNLDDNALYRHPALIDLRDLEEEEPLETEASKFALNYIKLPGGNIGCMVNGAGLAMATMDIIKHAGGAPANFLDVGGGADADQIEQAFRILIADRDVAAVLVNIFGGILRCDVLAEGVVAAARRLKVQIPIVVRMKGNNEERGRAMLRESGLDFRTADEMAEAARLVVAAAGGVR